MIVFDSYYEHLAVGIFTGFALDYFLLDFNLVETVLFYPALLLGALYPDIDYPDSYLGHKLGFVSRSIFEYFRHRIFTHSLLLMTSTFFVIVLFWGINSLLAGFTVGFLTHILGDLTNGKVALLYPLNKKKFGKRIYYNEK